MGELLRHCVHEHITDLGFLVAPVEGVACALSAASAVKGAFPPVNFQVSNIGLGSASKI